MIDGVICFLQVNEAYVQETIDFPCPLHQCVKGKQVISTTPSTAKAMMALTQEFGSGFHMIQDGFCEDYPGGIEEGIETLIITDGTAALLLKWDQ